VIQKVGDRPRLHRGHMLELFICLGVKQLAGRIEYSQGRHTLLQRNAVVLCDVEVMVILLDINIHEDEVLRQQLGIRRLMKVEIENLAVATPVATEGEDDLLMLFASSDDSGRDLGVSVYAGRVDMLARERMHRRLIRRKERSRRRNGLLCDRRCGWR
jgi:hypothetical protein